MLKPKVKLVYRKPSASTYSIEYLFHNIYHEIKEKHTQIDICEFELPAYSKGFWKRLRNIISLIRLEKGITHITGDSYYAILGAWFGKRVLTIHDLHFLTRTKGIKRILLRSFWVSLPIRFSHYITVVSEATRQAILEETGIKSDKIRVIHNFIDPIYKPVERDFNVAFPRILQIGTAFNKNIPNLVRALEGLTCTLVIIGRLSEEQKACLATHRISYENWSGLSLQQLYDEYARADLLSFVSTVEGFGLPILEAQATGLPVVTSNCSSMPEVAGGGAVLVDPDSPESIRKGILEVIGNNNLRNQIIEKGLHNVSRFSKEKIAADYLEVYQQLWN
jgi:glycosyltransferase involved in cell wall biosynthesis